MNYQVVRFVGERLGSPLYSKLIYLFLAYQLVVSALVFLFDSGFPAWVVIIGWALFIVLLAVRVLFSLKKETLEINASQAQEQERMQRISRLQKRLESDPNLQTGCRDCQYGGPNNDPCRAPGAGDREFRFRHDDVQSYCLLWSPVKTEARRGDEKNN